jgi:hypothetical protein
MRLKKEAQLRMQGKPPANSPERGETAEKIAESAGVDTRPRGFWKPGIFGTRVFGS